MTDNLDNKKDGHGNLVATPSKGSIAEDLDKLLLLFHGEYQSALELIGGLPLQAKAREKAKSALLALIRQEKVKELCEFYSWVQSQGRLFSEIKHHFEERFEQLKAKGEK